MYTIVDVIFYNVMTLFISKSLDAQSTLKRLTDRKNKFDICARLDMVADNAAEIAKKRERMDREMLSEYDLETSAEDLELSQSEFDNYTTNYYNGIDPYYGQLHSLNNERLLMIRDSCLTERGLDLPPFGN